MRLGLFLQLSISFKFMKFAKEAKFMKYTQDTGKVSH